MYSDDASNTTLRDLPVEFTVALVVVDPLAAVEVGVEVVLVVGAEAYTAS